MKTIYIEKMDKPKWSIRKIIIEGDSLKINIDLEKDKNIKKVINKLLNVQITNVVLSQKINENKRFIKALNANNINIFDGRWLEKYLAINILDYMVIKKNIEKQKTEIAITVNQISDLSIDIIKTLAKQYKKITVVTNHIEKLKKVENEIYEKEGIMIIVSNNKKKSLSKANIILNIDFNKIIFNKYRINENAIIVNLEGDMQIEQKRFNGLNINDYEIDVGRSDIIWRENMECFKTKDLLEAKLYVRDTYKNIYININKSKVEIKELYGSKGLVVI